MPLREKVVQMLREHPERLDMGIWLDGCGTVGCLAGHIVMATDQARYVDDDDCVAGLARQEWAAEYGWDSASHLAFYDYEWESLKPDVSFYDITAADVIAYLEGLELKAVSDG